MGNNDFTVEYPVIRYDSLRGNYSIELKMSTRPNSRVMIGGNISSTIFNQAFIGFDYHEIRRVSQRFYAGLYLGPIYSTGSIGGRTDLFYLKRPSPSTTPTTLPSRASATVLLRQPDPGRQRSSR